MRKNSVPSGCVNCALPSSIVALPSCHCHRHAAHCVNEFDLVQNKQLRHLNAMQLVGNCYIKIRLYGWSICKIVNLLVNNFASVLFDFVLRKGLDKQN